MRTALTAFISAASLCALGSAASAQTYYYGAPPTIASNTGTPAYSYETQVAPQPAFNGSCDIISGNRVCSAAPAYAAPAPAYAPGYGPVGAIVAAPFNAAGTVVTAPFGMFGAAPGDAGRLRKPRDAVHRRNHDEPGGDRHEDRQLREPCWAAARRGRSLRPHLG